MVDVSAILTCHGEGVLLGPTLNSFDAATRRAEQAGISVEKIIVLDRATSTTKMMISSHTKGLLKSNCTIITTDHGDPGQSRNSGVDASKGKYVTFLDGDDLWSENWITASLEMSQRSSIPVVLQSEVNVVFGKSKMLWVHANSLSPDFRLEDMLVQNYWDAMAFSEKGTYKKHRFEPIDLKTGYGHEDWYWNCETIADGIHHLPVPGTIHFKRARKGSQMSVCDTADVVLKPNPLTTFEGMAAAQEKLNSARNKLNGSYVGIFNFNQLAEQV